MLRPLVTNLNYRKTVADRAFQAALAKVREDPIVRAEILTLYAGCLLRSPQRRQCAADAVPLLKEARDFLPDRATPCLPFLHRQALRLLGEAHFLLWQHDEAAAAFEAALKITPDAWTAYHLGLALFRSVDGPEGLADLEHRKQVLLVAERHLRTAIALAPDHPSHHNTLGTLLDAQGRREEAVTEKLKAIDLHSSFTGYRSGAARTFALTDYYFSLGQTYLHIPGRREEGERMIEQAKREVSFDPFEQEVTP
jgi:tetratricopeptide (TPR) repeat protein